MMHLNRQQSSSFKYRQLRETISIRQSKRQEIFNKHRFGDKLPLAYHSDQSEDQSQSSNKRVIILDCQLQSEIREIMQKQVSEKDVPQLLQCLKSKITKEIIQGVIGIRKILATLNPPIQRIVKEGIDSILIGLVDHDSKQIQLQSCWALANIACGDNGQCGKLMKKGVFKCFIKCLKSDNKYIAEQAIWGIGNLASDSNQIRDQILKQQFLEALIQTIHRFEDKFIIEIACWSISNICRGKPFPSYELVKKGLVLLCCMIEGKCIEDEQILAGCISTIVGYLKQQEDTGSSSMVNKGLVLQIIRLLQQGEDRLLYSCLRFLNYLLVHQIQMSEIIMQSQFLDQSLTFLYHNKIIIRKGICDVLSMLALSNEEGVDKLINNCQLIYKLIYMLADDDVIIKVQIVQFFANLSENAADVNIFEFYVEISLFEYIVDILKEQNQDAVLKTLNNLNNILLRSQINFDNQQMMVKQFQKCNGLIMLNYLQSSPHHEIQELNFRIIGRFFQSQKLDNIYV